MRDAAAGLSSRLRGGRRAAAALQLLALVSVTTPASVRGLCVFSENPPLFPGCGPNDGCHPFATAPTPPQPLVLPPGSVGYVCPQYAASSCCNAAQNQLLYANFFLLDAYFGKVDFGGCPACAQNLKNMFCAYTCSPNQSDFVTSLNVTNMTNPTSGDLTTVLPMRIKISSKYACGIFGSCSATLKVKTYAPMNSCEGLLAYQGGTGAIPQGVFLEFEYSGDAQGAGVAPGALSEPALNCCSYPSNFSDPTGGNTSCPCASCSGCCAGGSCYDGVTPATSAGSGVTVNFTAALGQPDDDPLVGFDTAAVAALYGCALLASAVALGLRSPFVKAQAARAVARVLGGGGGGGADGGRGDESAADAAGGARARQRASRAGYAPPEPSS